MPGTYHLFYADAEGHAGTDLTFFPWPDMGPVRPGHGLAGEVSLAVPPASLPYWEERLRRYGVAVGGADSGTFLDVAEAADERRGDWGVGAIHHVALRVDDDAHQLRVRGRVEEVARPTPVIELPEEHQHLLRIVKTDRVHLEHVVALGA